jgi:hypothetical protein
VYILLRAVSRTGELLLKTLVRVGGLRKITSTPTMFLGARQRGMTKWSRPESGGKRPFVTLGVEPRPDGRST